MQPAGRGPLGPLDAFGPRSWARPEITGFGRLAMATPLARPDVVPLDGDWDFVLRDRPEAVGEADLVGSTEGWSTVAVPGCWTMQGFDRPHYTNVQMPFPGPPPAVPDANPTGVHRRIVTIPAHWRGRRIVLHVGGAESVLYVHVDGVAVGMGKDSRLAHDFDLTEHVEPGTEADLALTVVRWSDATYLEDQDHWHHAGLHRSVTLSTRPDVHIADVHAVADRDPATGTGRLAARVQVAATGAGPRGWKLRAAVAGAAGEAPARFEHPTNPHVNWLAFEGRGATLTLDLGAVAAWSAEAPVLHDLTVTLIDADGAEVDVVTLAVGFRRVEVVGHDLLVNGEAVLVKGVNRHDHDMRTGKAVSPAALEADIVAMKRHNLNAVRTSHYPNDPHLYVVCDRLGMYVFDEANVEVHGYLRSLTKDPVWASAILERVVRMAQRDKDHACVIVWSLGNESGVSPVHHAAAAWLRAYDPSRPVHYEGGITEDTLVAASAGAPPDLPAVLARSRAETDLIAPMYPSVEDLVAWATRGVPDRPLVMCEYAHAMGNAGGGLDAYWAAIRTHPGLQGGFVWDWRDQALVQVLPDGTGRLAYGGDFGDEPNDAQFCLNGVLAAEGTPHPSLLELAKVVQPVQITALDAGRGVLRVHNEHAFVDLSWLAPRWSVALDGVEVASGELAPLDLAAGASTTVGVAMPDVDPGPGQVAHLTLSFVTAQASAWAPAGHEVAWAQFEVARRPGPARAPIPADAPRRSSEGAAPTLAAFEPEVALWRAPIDNEVFGPGHARRWDELGLRDGPALVELVTTTTPGADGSLVVAHRVELPDHLVDIPRVGVRLRLGPGIARVEWLGAGPHESYGDRRASTRVGRWTTAVDDWAVAYVNPQASGNRGPVSWLRFLDTDGAPVLVVDELDGLEVTVSRVSEEAVAEATHQEELDRDVDECYVWIDARHRGVGTGACGPDTAPAHLVGPGTYQWSYRLVAP